MPTSQDLMGFGTPPAAAGLLGNDPSSINGAGTTQATATAIKSTLTSLTGASSQTGAILPSDGKIGTPYYVYDVGSVRGKVYCPVGHTLNGTSNGGCTFSALGVLIFMRISTSAWVVTGTATGSVA